MSWDPDNNEYVGKPKQKRRVIPFALIRKLNHESSEGGRAQCYVCKVYFCMAHIVLARVKPFQTEHVCRDCQRERRFPLVS